MVNSLKFESSIMWYQLDNQNQNLIDKNVNLAFEFIGTLC
jgi:hypothetical protein